LSNDVLQGNTRKAAGEPGHNVAAGQGKGDFRAAVTRHKTD